MAESNVSLFLRNETLHSLYASLDPKSLLIDSHQPQFLQFTTDSFMMERGPRYKEYSDLREKRLRMKRCAEQQQIIPEKVVHEKIGNRSVLTPPRKQVKFSSNLATPPKRPKGSSILTQSVPDFSSVLRKENRKPSVAMLPPLPEKCLTPPSGLLKRGSSKSTNSAEKRSGGLMMNRKSYASMEELKGIASAAANAINRENRGGGRKTVLGYTKF